MMSTSLQRHTTTPRGFTLIELMVVLGIFGLLLGMSVPSVQNWRRNYNVKSAATDLYATMQMARIGAIKSNQPWTMTLQNAPTPRYEVRDANNRVVREIIFPNRYRNDVSYRSPNGAGPIDAPVVTFNQSGFATTGFTYIAGTTTNTYYRIGIPFTSSAVQIQRWTGSAWQ